MSDDTDVEAPGWDAITAATDRLYKGQKERHVAAMPPPGMGGEDVLNGISIFEGTGDEPHWHYVTYGLTELFGKESSDPDESGYGFELTFRLKRGDETEPPRWPFENLQALGRYVFDSGNVFEPGQYRQRLAPIVQQIETDIFSLIFVADPDLPAMDTPNGRMRFVQAVGITNDEMNAVWNVGVEKVRELLARQSPKLVTDIARKSVLEDQALRREVEEQAARDGSPTGFIHGDQVEVEPQGEKATIVFGATTVSALLAVLPFRLPFGQSLVMVAGNNWVTFERGEANAFHSEGSLAWLKLDEAGLRELTEALRPIEGSYALPCLPGLTLRVEPTPISYQGKVLYRIGEAD